MVQNQKCGKKTADVALIFSLLLPLCHTYAGSKHAHTYAGSKHPSSPAARSHAGNKLAHMSAHNKHATAHHAHHAGTQHTHTRRAMFGQACSTHHTHAHQRTPHAHNAGSTCTHAHHAAVASGRRLWFVGDSGGPHAPIHGGWGGSTAGGGGGGMFWHRSEAGAGGCRRHPHGSGVDLGPEQVVAGTTPMDLLWNGDALVQESLLAASQNCH